MATRRSTRNKAASKASSTVTAVKAQSAIAAATAAKSRARAKAKPTKKVQGKRGRKALRDIENEDREVVTREKKRVVKGNKRIGEMSAAEPVVEKVSQTSRQLALPIIGYSIMVSSVAANFL